VAVAEPAEVMAVIGRVLRDELGVAREVRAEDDLLADLQLDSVGVLTLVVGLEDHFRIALGEQDAAVVRTVGDLAGLVAARAGGR
jgi:acyl carrier protein